MNTNQEAYLVNADFMLVHQQLYSLHKLSLSLFSFIEKDFLKEASSLQRYFIFMVSFGQFPENGQWQMAYIIYLIEVRRNTDKKLKAGSYKCNEFFY